MSASHLNALDLLGKQVSFTYFLGQSVGELVKKELLQVLLLTFLLHLKFV